jgi:hypothetical protein
VSFHQAKSRFQSIGKNYGVVLLSAASRIEEGSKDQGSFSLCENPGNGLNFRDGIAWGRAQDAGNKYVEKSGIGWAWKRARFESEPMSMIGRLRIMFVNQFRGSSWTRHKHEPTLGLYNSILDR